MEEALSFVRDAEAVLIPLYALTAPRDIRRAWGRARYLSATAIIRSIEKELPPGADSLPSALRALQEAAALFEEVRDAEHRALADVALARAYGANGDTVEARQAFERAVLLAQAGRERRAEIAGRYRRGRFLAGAENHREALDDFKAALVLVDSTGIVEYRARLYYEAASAYEAMGMKRETHRRRSSPHSLSMKMRTTAVPTRAQALATSRTTSRSRE